MTTTTDHTGRPARILACILIASLSLSAAVVVERAVPVKDLHLTLAHLHLSGWLVAVVLFLAFRGAFEFIAWPVMEYVGDRYRVEGFRVRRRPIAPGDMARHATHGEVRVLSIVDAPELGKPWAIVGPQAEDAVAVVVPLGDLERAS